MPNSEVPFIKRAILPSRASSIAANKIKITAKLKLPSIENLIELIPKHTPPKVSIFGSKYLVFIDETKLITTEQAGIVIPGETGNALDDGIDPLIGPSGSVAFVHCNVLHGSANNVSPWSRSIIYMNYNAVSNACTEATRPWYQNNRDFSPLKSLESDCIKSL